MRWPKVYFLVHPYYHPKTVLPTKRWTWTSWGHRIDWPYRCSCTNSDDMPMSCIIQLQIYQTISVGWSLSCFVPIVFGICERFRKVSDQSTNVTQLFIICWKCCVYLQHDSTPLCSSAHVDCLLLLVWILFSSGCSHSVFRVLHEGRQRHSHSPVAICAQSQYRYFSAVNKPCLVTLSMKSPLDFG